MYNYIIILYLCVNLISPGSTLFTGIVINDKLQLTCDPYLIDGESVELIMIVKDTLMLYYAQQPNLNSKYIMYIFIF